MKNSCHEVLMRLFYKKNDIWRKIFLSWVAIIVELKTRSLNSFLCYNSSLLSETSLILSHYSLEQEKQAVFIDFWRWDSDYAKNQT